MDTILILIIIVIAIVVYHNYATKQKVEQITNVKKPLTPYEILQFYPADRIRGFATDTDYDRIYLN